MLMIVRMRGEEMMREAGQARLAAEIRRAVRRTSPTARPARGQVVRLPHWLAVAAAKTRPTATGR